MNIYEIGQDFDNYKFFVFKEDDESNKGVWDYNGQSLINEWKGLSLELFRDKRKKKDKRSEEFDASCYFSGCLIVNKRTSFTCQCGRERFRLLFYKCIEYSRCLKYRVQEQ